MLPFLGKTDLKKEKTWSHLRMSRILFAAKHSWTTLPMSRTLFVDSICSSRVGLSANEKEEKFASNHK